MAKSERVSQLFTRAVSRQRAGDLAAALQLYDEILEQDDSVTDAWFNKANVLAQTGEFDEALRCYETALGLADTSKEMYMARQICGSCTHKTECLEWALVHERHGIWGGTNEATRASIRRMRSKRSVNFN